MAVMNKYNPSFSYFSLLVALVLLVSAASTGHAQGHQGGDAALGIKLNGTLYCTPDGSPMKGGSGGAAGVNVTLSCGMLFDNHVVASNVTDSQGMYKFMTRVSLMTLGQAFRSECQVVVRLPVSNSTCRRFPLFGRLRAPVVVASADVSQNNVTFVLTPGKFEYSVL